MRLSIYKANYAIIKKHNATLEGFSLEINRFADWSQAEVSKFLTYKPDPNEVYPVSD